MVYLFIWGGYEFFRIELYEISVLKNGVFLLRNGI